MEGAHFQDVLFPDDFFEPQAPGLAHVHLDDEGPLPFDVHLGHSFAHAAPNQAAGQDGPAFEDFANPFMQPGLGNEDRPDLVDLEYEQADEVPHHLPVALDAVEEVITFLQANLPELALHPNGPGLVLALHAALGHYMLAHGMGANVPATHLAPHEDLPPQDGFVEVAVQPADDGEAFVHWPEVQDDGDVEVDELFGEDDVPVHLQDAHDHPEVEHEEHNAPLGLEHVLEVLHDVEPALVGEPEPAMEPELVNVFADVAPVDAVVANHENEDAGAANVAEQEDTPLYVPPQEPEPDGVVDAAEPEHEAIADVYQQIEEGALPEASQEMQNPVEPAGERTRTHPNIAVDNAEAHVHGGTTGPSMSANPDELARLDENGRAALSTLCARFAVADDPSSTSEVLVEAMTCIRNLQNSLDELTQLALPVASQASRLNHTERIKKSNPILKLRDAWNRAFSSTPSKGAIG